MNLPQRTRYAARVLILDEQGRILLVRGHDADNPARQWWFTIGGGIDDGETPLQAAVRELFEETGITLSESDLQGPVLKRSAIFDFEAEHVLQHERFYLARVSSSQKLSRDNWTEVERSFVDDLTWLSVTQLQQADCEVFPRELSHIVEKLNDGWDGTVLQLGLETDGIRI